MPAPAPAPAFFVPWKSATTDVGTTQYGTYLRVTAPSSDRSATFRRKIPLLSHYPPDSMAVSFVSLLFSMKCFWKTSAAPPAPIVVTAPQYSHTTSASPADGFIGPPHELHLKFCGIGGRIAASIGPHVGVGSPLSAAPRRMARRALWGSCFPPSFAPLYSCNSAS